MRIDERGPCHIGIILDGNRRWAKSRGLNTIQGHQAGADNVKKIVNYSYECGLKYLTLYAFSTENWKRNPAEVSLLIKLLNQFTEELLNSNDKRDIRIIIYGDITAFDEKLQKNILDLENRTKDNKTMTLGICLNYGGRNEILNAVKQISKNIKDGIIGVEDITESTISSLLYTKNVPDPDLIIRTSNEYRLSNFLTWQSTYSELYFPKNIMWPDFDKNQFDKAIEEYIKRNRRFGGN